MLNVYTSGRKKGRTWSTGTVLVSLGAHAVAAFFALILPFGPGEATQAAEPVLVEEWDITKPRRHPDPPAAPTADEERPADEPVVGRTLQVTEPLTVPPMLPDPNLNARPLDPRAFDGPGPVGDVIGTPTPGDTRPLTGNPGPAGPADVVYDEGDVGEVPALTNADDLRRVFERFYPSMLRDSGVRGRAVLQFVVNADGRVDPSSVVVVSATRPEFATASTRAVERFRFRPATVYGQPVRVLITMPIDWTVAQE